MVGPVTDNTVVEARDKVSTPPEGEDFDKARLPVGAAPVVDVEGLKKANDREMQQLGFKAANEVIALEGGEDELSPTADAAADKKVVQPEKSGGGKQFRDETDRLIAAIAKAHGVDKLEELVGVEPASGQTGYTARRNFRTEDGKDVTVWATHKPDTIVAERGSDIYVLNLQNPELNLKFSRHEQGEVSITGSILPGTEKAARFHIEQATRALTEQSEKDLRAGRKEEAEQGFKAALAVAGAVSKEHIAGIDQRLFADTFSQIGRAHRGNDSPALAAEFMEKALAAYVNVPDSREAMHERRALAHLYHTQKQPEKALAHADMAARTLEKYERDHGTNDLSAVEERKHLASLYTKLGKLEKAEEILNRSLENLRQQEKLLGKDNQDVVNERDRLAVHFHELSDAPDQGAKKKDQLQQRAAGLLQESFAVLRDIVERRGPRDHQAIRIKSDLDALYGPVLGHSGGAIVPRRLLNMPFLEKTLPEAEKRLGADSKEAMDQRRELAILYSFSGRKDDAANLLNKSIKLIEQQPGKGPEHQDLIPVLETLGWAMRRDNNLAGARDAFQRMLRIQEKHLDKGSASTRRLLEFLEEEIKK